MNLTNSTDIVIRDVPSPSGYSIPFANFDFHLATLTRTPRNVNASSCVMASLSRRALRVMMSFAARPELQFTWPRLGKPYLWGAMVSSCVTKYLSLSTSRTPLYQPSNSLLALL